MTMERMRSRERGGIGCSGGQRGRGAFYRSGCGEVRG
jgi:hypothetical protein